MDSFALFTALTLGFFGSSHCIGMCGGIAGALGFAVREVSPWHRFTILCAYNVGRISSYLVIALLVYLIILAGRNAVGDAVPSIQGISYLRLLAGLLMIAMGLYLAQWWMGLAYLERFGAGLWRHIQPLGQRLFPVQSAGKALLLGLVWGWLPCGLVYSALAFAVVQPTLSGVLATMLAFALGTLPALLAAGFAAEWIKRWLQNNRIRKLLAITIIGFGVWTSGYALYHGVLHKQGGHQGHNAMESMPVESGTETPEAEDVMPMHHHH